MCHTVLITCSTLAPCLLDDFVQYHYIWNMSVSTIRDPNIYITIVYLLNLSTIVIRTRPCHKINCARVFVYLLICLPIKILCSYLSYLLHLVVAILWTDCRSTVLKLFQLRPCIQSCSFPKTFQYMFSYKLSYLTRLWIRMLLRILIEHLI